MNSSTRPSTRIRTLAWGAIPVLLTGALVTVDRIPGTDITLTVPYAAEGPGPVVDTLGEVDGTKVVDVEAPETFDTTGELSMTTVSVRTNMTLAQALGRWMFTDDTIVPIDTVIPQDMSDEDVQEANQQAFIQSESAATLAAMDYLQLPVKIQVAQVLDDMPAADVVELNDIITGVDGEEVSDPVKVQELIQAKQPGDDIELTLDRGGKEVTETVELGENPHQSGSALLGVSMLTVPDNDVEVDYNLQDIGGPSAGMMFSLAVIDKLSPGDLNGGKRVAGTGTIGEDGAIGPIGGIVHKVGAAAEQGSELFLAPAQNCAEAVSRDHGGMVVASVETLDDAISTMEDFAAGKPINRC